MTTGSSSSSKEKIIANHPRHRTWKERNIHNDTKDENDDDYCEAAINLFSDNSNKYLEEITEFQFPGLPSPSKTIIRLRGSLECTTSTGLGFWAGAELLCEFLIHHPSFVRDKNVLELGSGTGLCGIVVGQCLGARRVIMTDGDVHVLSNLQENIELNKNDALLCNNDDNNKTTITYCSQLIWGQDLDTFAQEHGDRHDVLLASDCVYMPQSLEPLWKTVDRLLTLEEDGLFVYVNVCASQSPFELVLKTACRFGFVMVKKNVDLLPESSPSSPDVHLFRRRKQKEEEAK